MSNMSNMSNISNISNINNISNIENNNAVKEIGVKELTIGAISGVPNVDHSDVTKALKIEFTELPPNVSISTMTVTCKLGVNIYLENFANLVELKDREIMSLKYGNKAEYVKSINLAKKSKKTKAKTKKNFYNQITMEVISGYSEKSINVKLFKNGAVQMTGCKSINDMFSVVELLIVKLKEEKAILVNGEIIEKNFVDDVNKMHISNINIAMINSNFRVDYSINREILYNILSENGVTCSYEPCTHACVNIKYRCPIDDKVISIFVFQSGSIIITGANHVNHIVSAHDYIIDVLNKNHEQVVKKKIETILKMDKDIADIIKSVCLKFKQKDALIEGNSL